MSETELYRRFFQLGAAVAFRPNTEGEVFRRGVVPITGHCRAGHPA